MRTKRQMRAMVGLQALVVAVGVGAGQAFATEVRIDFGDAATAPANAAGKVWTNVTNPWSGTFGLKDYATGSNTAWTLGITKPFALGIDSGGTTAPTGAALALAPATATKDSFATIGTYAPGQITLKNLNVAETYNLGLFSSYMNATLGKTTYDLSGQFTARGANTVTGILNAAKNSSNVLTLANLKPAANGTITLDVGAAAANNALLDPVFLNAMTLTSFKPTPPTPAAKNLLFFGNSFTAINDVPTLVGTIAVADGKPQPYVVGETADSRSLDDQLLEVKNNPQNNIKKIAAGKTWDDVVIQEFSSKPTHVDNAADFRVDAVTLYKAVEAVSPNVKPVLYETWAYRPNSTTAYSATPAADQWTNAAQMQSELRTNYGLAKTDLDAVDGMTTLLASVGDKWQQGGWSNDFYDTYDDKHPSTRGSLLSALVLYSTIYGENVSDIPFAQISAWATPRGITAADWARLTSLVDTNPTQVQSLMKSGMSMSVLADLAVSVPEPTTLAGLLMLGGFARRVRKA